MKVILDAEQIDKTLRRLAEEIAAQTSRADDPVIEVR